METLLAGFLFLAGGVFFLKFVLWISTRGALKGENVRVSQPPAGTNEEWTFPIDGDGAKTYYPEGRMQPYTWNTVTKQYENGYKPSDKLADKAEHNDTYRIEPFSDFMKGK